MQAIPASLGQLQMLEVLNCNDNEISSIPSEVLTGCHAMHTLELHANPISPQVSTVALVIDQQNFSALPDLLARVNSVVEVLS